MTCDNEIWLIYKKHLVIVEKITVEYFIIDNLKLQKLIDIHNTF